MEKQTKIVAKEIKIQKQTEITQKERKKENLGFLVSLSLFLLFEWIESSIDHLCSHAEAEQGRNTTWSASHISRSPRREKRKKRSPHQESKNATERRPFPSWEGG